MIYQIIFFILVLIATGIIVNHNCNCNEDKDKYFDVIQIWFVFIFSLFFVDLKSILIFICIIILSVIFKEVIKIIFRKKKKSIKITKEDCDCKDAYKRFF